MTKINNILKNRAKKYILSFNHKEVTNDVFKTIVFF